MTHSCSLKLKGQGPWTEAWTELTNCAPGYLGTGCDDDHSCLWLSEQVPSVQLQNHKFATKRVCQQKTNGENPFLCLGEVVVLVETGSGLTGKVMIIKERLYLTKFTRQGRPSMAISIGISQNQKTLKQRVCRIVFFKKRIIYLFLSLCISFN